MAVQVVYGWAKSLSLNVAKQRGHTATTLAIGSNLILDSSALRKEYARKWQSKYVLYGWARSLPLNVAKAEEGTLQPFCGYPEEMRGHLVFTLTGFFATWLILKFISNDGGLHLLHQLGTGKSWFRVFWFKNGSKYKNLSCLIICL